MFYNCPKLMSITVPSSCRTIGENAFGYIESTDAEGNKTPVKLEGFRQKGGGISIFKLLAILCGVAAGGAAIWFLVRVIRKNQMTEAEHEENVIAGEEYTGITEDVESNEQEEQT